MQNPLSKMVEDTKSGMAETSGIGAELKAKQDMLDAAKPAPAVTPKPMPVRTPSTWEKAAGRPAPKGEKEMYKSATEWASPKSFKEGGPVEKTGVAVVDKGEHVLTPDQKHHVFNLAETALSHMKEPDPEPPKKEVKEMHMRKGANGGFIVKHLHVHAHLHPDEENVHAELDGVHDNLEHHWGKMNEGEQESEMEEAPGTKAAEEAVGLK
jgi:hypothetical protein